MRERYENETFEQWISRTMELSDVTVTAEDGQVVTKLRDSGRVCFLENKKKYENSEAALAEGKLPETEIAVVEKDLVKFADRARKYLARYAHATEVLKGIREAAEQAKKQATEATVETLTDAVGGNE